MRKLPILTFFVAFFAISSSPFKGVEGRYHIGSAPISDPAVALPPNTHIYLNVNGEAAQNIYNSLEGGAKLNECGIDHYEKSSGKFTCSFFPSNNKYSCDFSINIKTGDLDIGGVC